MPFAEASDASVVVVHDAARPFVTADLVERCIAGLDGVDGAIAAAPVTDTVKEADASGRVLRTLDRSVLWAVQTPQVFRADVLRRALDVDESVLAAATDDASLVEAAGGHGEGRGVLAGELQGHHRSTARRSRPGGGAAC